MSAVLASEGARLFGDVVRKFNAAEVGRRLDVSEGMVRHIVAGRKSPGDALKHRISDAWQIPTPAWTAPAATSARRGAALAKPATVAPNAIVSGIVELRGALALFDARIVEAQADPSTPSGAWVALLRGKADAAAKLAGLQGEGELTIAMIVRSRAWREVLERLAPVFDEHPEVAAKIADAFGGEPDRA